MTVASEISRAQYNGNGATVNFAVPFYFLANAHVEIISTVTATGIETVLAETTNYTLAGAGNPAGGTATMLVAPATGTTITILRKVPVTQEADYVEGDIFPAVTHEGALDKLDMIAQQLMEAIGRALRMKKSSALTNVEVGTPAASAILRWNSAGTAIESGPTVADITVPVSVLADTIHSATGKSTPVDADELPLVDSEAANVLKKLTWANLKATLKAYFDTFYVALTGAQSISGTKTFTGDVNINKDLKIAQTTDATTTGSNANIASRATAFIRLTNASLVSIGSIALGGAVSGHLLLLENDTGNSIDIVNNYGGAPANTAILTGTGADLLLLNKQAIWILYNSAGWQVMGAAVGAVNLKTNQTVGGVKTFTSSVITSKGATLTPAASTLTIDSTGDYYTVAAGSFNNIATSGGSSATGARTAAGIAREITLEFEGVGTITAAAALRLAGADASGTVYGANITTYPGLVLRLREESANNWRCIGGNTLFGDYGSQDFTDVTFTPSGTASLENITGAGKEFPFTPKFTGVYELEWVGTVFAAATTTDEVNLAVDASAGSPTVIRKAILYIYSSAGDHRRGQNPKTIFSLVAGTAYTFNVQIRNLTATRSVAVGYSAGSSGAGKWFIKRIA